MVAPLHWAEDRGFALLENCATLEVVAFASDELWAAVLTVVQPSRAC